MDIEQSLARQLNSLSRRWRMAGDQALVQLGVSNATGWCLLYLSRLGEDARQSDLAREIGVREATLARTLAQLETGGLIERFPNPKDARCNIMRLSEQGHGIVQQIEDVLSQLRHDLLGGISDADLAVMQAACNVMDARFTEKRV